MSPKLQKRGINLNLHILGTKNPRISNHKKIPVILISQNPFRIDYNENQPTLDNARRDKSRFSLF